MLVYFIVGLVNGFDWCVGQFKLFVGFKVDICVVVFKVDDMFVFVDGGLVIVCVDVVQYGFDVGLIFGCVIGQRCKIGVMIVEFFVFGFDVLVVVGFFV